MKIVVLANDVKWEELKTASAGMDISRAGDLDIFLSNAAADIYINLNADAAEKNYAGITKPVLINSVSVTLKEMSTTPNILRINGWNTFLKRDVWEIAGEKNETIEAFFTQLNKKIVDVPDEPGFVSARIIALIVNEAYFALGEAVSTKEEIDTAMKLGTNYPYGPFEWGDKIGLNNIYSLLQKLVTMDKRYQPAQALIKEVTIHR